MERKTSKKAEAPKAPGKSQSQGSHREPSEREELIHNPNFNQAGNEAGSRDQSQGSQTGNDIDTIP